MTKTERAMDVGNVGQVIALRELYYFDDNQKKTVKIIVGKPQIT